MGVAAPVDEVFAGFLSSRSIHHRAAELFRDQGFRGLGAEVAQIDEQRVAARSFDILDRFQHVFFVFHRNFTFIDAAALCGIGVHDRLAAALGQRNDEAVARDCDDTKLDFRDIFHGSSLLT